MISTTMQIISAPLSASFLSTSVQRRSRSFTQFTPKLRSNARATWANKIDFHLIDSLAIAISPKLVSSWQIYFHYAIVKCSGMLSNKTIHHLIAVLGAVRSWPSAEPLAASKRPSGNTPSRALHQQMVTMEPSSPSRSLLTFFCLPRFIRFDSSWSAPILCSQHCTRPTTRRKNSRVDSWNVRWGEKVFFLSFHPRSLCFLDYRSEQRTQKNIPHQQGKAIFAFELLSALISCSTVQLSATLHIDRCAIQSKVWFSFSLNNRGIFSQLKRSHGAALHKPQSEALIGANNWHKNSDEKKVFAPIQAQQSNFWDWRVAQTTFRFFFEISTRSRREKNIRERGESLGACAFCNVYKKSRW